MEWHENRYQHTLAGSKRSSYRTEADAAWNIRVGNPVQVALSVRLGKYSCEAHIVSVTLATIEMADETH